MHNRHFGLLWVRWEHPPTRRAEQVLAMDNGETGKSEFQKPLHTADTALETFAPPESGPFTPAPIFQEQVDASWD